MTEGLWAPVAGRYGKTRDGWKVGPMSPRENAVGAFWVENVSLGSGCWRPNGAFWTSGTGHGCDLVSEWIDDSPAPSKPIDFSKIKVGDRVRLGGEFEVKFPRQGDKVCCVHIGKYGYDLVPEMIAEHIPTNNRPIEIGSKIIAGTAPREIRGVVKAVDGNEAWILWEHGSRGGWPVYELRLDDEPA